MATGTFWQRGESLDYTNSGDSKINAGTIVVIGSRVGVVGCDIPAGETGSVHVEGVFEVPKEYAASDKALTLGQEVQWDNSNGYFKAAVAMVVGTGGDAGKVTTAPSAVNGYVVKASASADRTVLVKINA